MNIVPIFSSIKFFSTQTIFLLIFFLTNTDALETSKPSFSIGISSNPSIILGIEHSIGFSSSQYILNSMYHVEEELFLYNISNSSGDLVIVYDSSKSIHSFGNGYGIKFGFFKQLSSKFDFGIISSYSKYLAHSSNDQIDLTELEKVIELTHSSQTLNLGTELNISILNSNKFRFDIKPSLSVPLINSDEYLSFGKFWTPYNLFSLHLKFGYLI